MNRAALEKMLAAGTDNALLRFTLGGLYSGELDRATAVEHLTHAVALDPTYSAAYKALGASLAALAFTQGTIEAG